MVWIEVVLVVLDEIARNGFAIVRREQLSGRMPQLPQVVRFLEVEGIFESRVAVAKLLEEGMFGGESIEIERVARRKDDDLVGEIAIIGIVEAIYALLQLTCSHCHARLKSDLL